MNHERPQTRRGHALGLAGAACVACCAGPVLAAVGGIGAAGSLAVSLLWPAAGAAIAITTVAVVVILRRRRPEPSPAPVPVELSPQRRTSWERDSHA